MIVWATGHYSGLSLLGETKALGQDGADEAPQCTCSGMRARPRLGGRRTRPASRQGNVLLLIIINIY